MPKSYRQGDILIRLVTRSDHLEVAGPVLVPEDGRLILARGEVTGHHHSLAAEDAQVITAAEGVFLRIMAPTPLEHQEHAAIVLEPGWYQVVRQREYAPEAPRQVAD